MKYKDFDGSVETLIQMKLREIEEKEQVKILHAVESGSRAWKPLNQAFIRLLTIPR